MPYWHLGSILCWFAVLLVAPLPGLAMSAQVSLQETITTALSDHKNGRVEEAINGYEAALATLAGPAKAKLHSNVASLYLLKNNTDRSRYHFEAALNENPQSAEAHFNLAVLLTTKLNEHGKAIKHCGRSLQLDPSYYKSLHLMGNILQTLGKQEDAERYFVRAEELAKKVMHNADDRGGDVADNSDRRGSETNGDSSGGDSTAGDTEVARKLSSFFESWPLNKSSTDHDTVTSSASDRIQCLSQRPGVWVVHNFLSPEECRHIALAATPQLEKSYVSGGSSVQTKPLAESEASTASFTSAHDTSAAIVQDRDAYRSSYNAWLGVDPVISSVQSRLARLLGLPIGYLQTYSEQLQVVKYDAGGQFKVHHDSSVFQPRFLTALMYLNAVESEEYAGGGTWFPFAQNCSQQGTKREEEPKEGTEAVEASEYGGSSKSSIECPDNVDDAIRVSLEEYHRTRVSANTNVHSDDKAGAKEAYSLPGLVVHPQAGSIAIFLNHDWKQSADPTEENAFREPWAVHAGLPVLRRSARAAGSSDGDADSNSIDTGNHDEGDTCSAMPAGRKVPERSSDERMASAEPVVPRTKSAFVRGEKWVANYWLRLDSHALAQYL